MEETALHHVTRFDEADLAVPRGFDAHSVGYRRVSHIDRAAGAIHTGFGTCEITAGGRIDAHVHAYEEFVYVLEGNPVLVLDGRGVELGPDTCAFVPVGATHSLKNEGGAPCRWIDLQSPQARPPTDPPDTFFVPDPDTGEVAKLDVRDPRTRSFARWTPAQMDVDSLKRPAPVDAAEVSSSMSSALLAYSGIGVKMLLDERHGAHLGNLFMVDYQVDAILHPHDHPIEEAFYVLEGEVVYVADGEEYTLRVGDIAYAGVGCIHAFENRSGKGTRWLESRAPLPPLHHAYRFNRDWGYLSERVGTGRAA